MAREKKRKAERPEIELYMYSLNQEFPASKGHAHFLKRHSETKPDLSRELVRVDAVESQIYNRLRPEVNDWSVQWISNEWIENHTKAAGVGIRSEFDPFLNVRVREEDFGAIIFEPTTDRVFKVNKAGLRLFEEMRESYRAGARDLRKFKTEEFAAEDVARFTAFLHGAGLWTL